MTIEGAVTEVIDTPIPTINKKMLAMKLALLVIVPVVVGVAVNVIQNRMNETPANQD